MISRVMPVSSSRSAMSCSLMTNESWASSCTVRSDGEPQPANNPRLATRAIGKTRRMSDSLRWHYPDQVHGSTAATALSAHRSRELPRFNVHSPWYRYDMPPTYIAPICHDLVSGGARRCPGDHDLGDLGGWSDPRVRTAPPARHHSGSAAHAVVRLVVPGSEATRFDRRHRASVGAQVDASFHRGVRDHRARTTAPGLLASRALAS